METSAINFHPAFSVEACSSSKVAVDFVPLVQNDLLPVFDAPSLCYILKLIFYQMLLLWKLLTAILTAENLLLQLAENT